MDQNGISGENICATSLPSDIEICQTVNKNDVWYTFRPLRDGEANITVFPYGSNPVEDISIELLSGECELLETIDCVNSFGRGSGEVLTSIISGEINYYIRVYSESSINNEDLNSNGEGTFFININPIIFLPDESSNIPDISTLEINACNSPYTASFESVKDAIGYEIEITILSQNNQVFTYRIDENMISSDFIPNRLLGAEVEIKIAAIFWNEDTGEEMKGEFSDSTNFIFECSDNGSTIIETRSSNSNKLEISPNPVQSFLQLQLISDVEQSSTLKVIDLGGKVLLRKAYNLLRGENKTTLDVRSLQAGQYILQIHREGKINQVKFVKL
ncbi:MAG: T9SS type A sorting domain-containing protein [Bacteroidota bacterium]